MRFFAYATPYAALMFADATHAVALMRRAACHAIDIAAASRQGMPAMLRLRRHYAGCRRRLPPLLRERDGKGVERRQNRTHAGDGDQNRRYVRVLLLLPLLRRHADTMPYVKRALLTILRSSAIRCAR